MSQGINLLDILSSSALRSPSSNSHPFTSSSSSSSTSSSSSSSSNSPLLAAGDVFSQASPFTSLSLQQEPLPGIEKRDECNSSEGTENLQEGRVEERRIEDDSCTRESGLESLVCMLGQVSHVVESVEKLLGDEPACEVLARVLSGKALDILGDSRGISCGIRDIHDQLALTLLPCEKGNMLLNMHRNGLREAFQVSQKAFEFHVLNGKSEEEADLSARRLYDENASVVLAAVERELNQVLLKQLYILLRQQLMVLKQQQMQFQIKLQQMLNQSINQSPLAPLLQLHLLTQAKANKEKNTASGTDMLSRGLDSELNRLMRLVKSEAKTGVSLSDEEAVELMVECSKQQTVRKKTCQKKEEQGRNGEDHDEDDNASDDSDGEETECGLGLLFDVGIAELEAEGKQGLEQMLQDCVPKNTTKTNRRRNHSHAQHRKNARSSTAPKWDASHLVGERVQIQWEEMWFPGTVRSYSARSGLTRVVYDNSKSPEDMRLFEDGTAECPEGEDHFSWKVMDTVEVKVADVLHDVIKQVIRDDRKEKARRRANANRNKKKTSSNHNSSKGSARGKRTGPCASSASASSSSSSSPVPLSPDGSDDGDSVVQTGIENEEDQSKENSHTHGQRRPNHHAKQHQQGREDQNEDDDQSMDPVAQNQSDSSDSEATHRNNNNSSNNDNKNEPKTRGNSCRRDRSHSTVTVSSNSNRTSVASPLQEDDQPRPPITTSASRKTRQSDSKNTKRNRTRGSSARNEENEQDDDNNSASKRRRRTELEKLLSDPIVSDNPMLVELTKDIPAVPRRSTACKYVLDSPTQPLSKDQKDTQVTSNKVNNKSKNKSTRSEGKTRRLSRELGQLFDESSVKQQSKRSNKAPKRATRESVKPEGIASRRQKRACREVPTTGGIVDPDAPFGRAAVGHRVKVFWPLEKRFFAGTVVEFNGSLNEYRVNYDDGDVEWLNFARERVTWV